LALVTPTASRADIAVSLAPFLVTTSPSTCHHESPSRSRRTVHCRRTAPSITVEEPSIAVNPSTAFKSPPLRPLLSIAVESPSCLSLLPSIAVHHSCDRSPSPSPLRSCCPWLYRHQEAAAPSIAVKEPSRRPLTSRRAVHHRRVAVHCRQSVHCFQVSVTPSIAIHRRQVAVVPSIAVHHPLLLSLSCAIHCCPRR